MTEIARLTYPEISHFYMVGSKKHYLTANIFYAGCHWATRTKIVEMAKVELMQKAIKLRRFNELPIVVNIVYHSKKTTFDIDNKAYFWAKCFFDFIKTKGLLPDDNVKFICSLHLDYEKSTGADMLEIIIKTK